MVYILRTHLNKKYLLNGLTSVYGIGFPLSKSICLRLGFQRKFLLADISEEDVFLITQLVDELQINIKGDLQRWLKQKLDLLGNLKTFRGLRLRQGLPLRGQRTHTNARTSKRLRLRKVN